MLRQRDVVRYLLERGLLQESSILDGDLEVLDVARRNQNYKVLTSRGPSYMLKLGLGRDRGATVANEAGVYRYLTTEPSGLAELGGFLPKFFGFDLERRVLITELIRGGEDLRSFHLREGQFSTESAVALGTALGRLHRVTHDPNAARTADELNAEPPWILSIHRPESTWLRRLNPPNIELIKTIQRHDEFSRAIEWLRTTWRCSTFVHGDLRWDNCIVSAQHPGSLKLVDWELARWGEPLYDVGSAFAEYLNFWLGSIPVTGTDPVPRATELARCPLEEMQPAIGAFWRAYLEEAGPALPDERASLERAVRFAALRVVHSSFELSERSLFFTGNVATALQLSFNMLLRPREAATHLLGIATPLGPNL